MEPDPRSENARAPETVGDLDRDTELERRGPGEYVGAIDRGWWVDRGPNGGFLAALMLRAAVQAVDDGDRMPCSLTVHYLAAAQEGPVTIGVETVRVGRRVTNCRVLMSQHGEAVAVALVALSSQRSSSEPFDETVFPAPPAPETLESLRVDLPGVPPYLANYDLRFALGHMPFTAAPEALTGVWVRTARMRRPDVLAVVAFADSWAHAPLARRRTPAPTPTVDLTVHFRNHAWYTRARADDFVLAVFRSRLLFNGLFEEDGELWSPDGIMLAHSRQLGLLLD